MSFDPNLQEFGQPITVKNYLVSQGPTLSESQIVPAKSISASSPQISRSNMQIVQDR